MSLCDLKVLSTECALISDDAGIPDATTRDRVISCAIHRDHVKPMGSAAMHGKTRPSKRCLQQLISDASTGGKAKYSEHFSGIRIRQKQSRTSTVLVYKVSDSPTSSVDKLSGLASTVLGGSLNLLLAGRQSTIIRKSAPVNAEVFLTQSTLQKTFSVWDQFKRPRLSRSSKNAMY